MSNYWGNRLLKQQDAISNKNIKDIEKRLKKYYRNSFEKIWADFEATYEKLLATVRDGREPTPADLYRLDRYWQMQNQVTKELQKLGDTQIELLSKRFMEDWIEVYESISLPSDTGFSTFSTAMAEEMINQIWVADGKHFSQRIWDNTQRLIQTLNEQLVHCVVTGKKTTDLKKLLQERFDVSYSQADTLVRTEIANIQTQAAKKRYEDYGLTKYRFLGREEGKCGHTPDCHDLDGKTFLMSAMKVGVNAPPIHPNCRCAVVPVVEDELNNNGLRD